MNSRLSSDAFDGFFSTERHPFELFGWMVVVLRCDDFFPGF